jgi:hypothetical protein
MLSRTIATLLLAAELSCTTSFTAPLHHSTKYTRHTPSPTLVGAFPQDHHDYTHEDILLKIHWSVRPTVSIDDALPALSHYLQTFPFAAVLPVQPLTYTPTVDGGVHISFLRKKTPDKPSVDGGIRIFVALTSGSNTTSLSEDNEPLGLELTAKRNSQGQFVPKLFAEKLVVTTLVASLTSSEDDDAQPFHAKAALSLHDQIQMESIFHKWM